ncbi:MAG: hypothetical protein H0T42_30210 [Deltaproteobacteria bacterium]|nr:hypothetical protein [Deltaproteobacteria bacterium]
MRLAWLVLLAACSSSRATDWPKLEEAVEAICKCTSKDCVARESHEWFSLPWPDLRFADRKTHDRTIALSDRGTLCMLRWNMKEDIDMFAAWAKRTCACTDAACANAVDDEIVMWRKKMEHEIVTGNILGAARDAVIQHDACFAKLSGGARQAASTLPSTMVERIAATADLICACSTLVCADLHDEELVTWIESRYYRPESDPTTGMVLSGPAKASNTRLLKCHAGLSTRWPHKTRLEGAYGIGP